MEMAGKGFELGKKLTGEKCLIFLGKISLRNFSSKIRHFSPVSFELGWKNELPRFTLPFKVLS